VVDEQTLKERQATLIKSEFLKLQKNNHVYQDGHFLKTKRIDPERFPNIDEVNKLDIRETFRKIVKPATTSPLSSLQTKKNTI
jgi:hypothetical protein